MTEADRQPPTASPYQIFMLVCRVLVLAAYVPDLPGCVATGDTKRAVAQRIREAIAFRTG